MVARLDEVATELQNYRNRFLRDGRKSGSLPQSIKAGVSRLLMTFACYDAKRSSSGDAPFPTPTTSILPDDVPARLLPFGDLLVMMKPQSLELHSIENRFGQRRFYDPR
jgi:hypothetical protein